MPTTAYCAIPERHLHSVKSSCRFRTQSQFFWPVLERIHFYTQPWNAGNSRSFSRRSLFFFFKWYFVSRFENTGENYTEHSSTQNSNLLILKVVITEVRMTLYILVLGGGPGGRGNQYRN